MERDEKGDERWGRGREGKIDGFKMREKGRKMDKGGNGKKGGKR